MRLYCNKGEDIYEYPCTSVDIKKCMAENFILSQVDIQ